MDCDWFIDVFIVLIVFVGDVFDEVICILVCIVVMVGSVDCYSWDQVEWMVFYVIGWDLWKCIDYKFVDVDIV